MSKTWQTRLSETITFIGSATADTYAGDRSAIVSALNDWKTTNAGAAMSLSAKMSQEGSTNRPKSKPQRAYRRSIILLKCAIAKPDKQNEWDEVVRIANLQKPHTLPAQFANELADARDNLGSLAASVNPMINELQSNPLKFLQNNLVTIAGKKDSNAHDYGFYMTKGGYKIDPFDWNPGHQKIRAINVPAILFSDVMDSLDQLQGTRSANVPDAAVMFTTQFTGCTYCFSVNGGSIVAAHIDPGGGVGRVNDFDGVGISQKLRDDGDFANGNGGEFNAYGRIAGSGFGYPTDAEQMTIVAVRSNNNVWGVYSQIIKGGKIASAQKIG